MVKLAFILSLVVFITGCQSGSDKTRDTAEISTEDTMTDTGYKQVVNLPPPNEKESEVKFSKVIGWKEGVTPKVEGGLSITKFASGLKSPRNIYVAPNGDVFVALANTESKGLKKVKDEISGKDDSQHTGKSLNQIYLLRDTNGDGTPEIQNTYLGGLNQPFGIVVLNNYFYVATTDGLWRYPYDEKAESMKGTGEKILELPAGGYNNHWTRNIITSKDGKKIYVSVGSASNNAEYGFTEEEWRACILEVNPDGTDKRIFADGLRNPVGMDINPVTGELWTVVNERDKLGDNLVPDYLTSVKEGGFYGWPYSYIGQHLDPRIKKEDQKPELVERAIIPDLLLDAHSSSLGLVFYDRENLPSNYKEGAFVTQHGSWNRSSFTGYKILFVPFNKGRIAGPPQDFITGFIADPEKSEVYGRPVATAITREGHLLITDDASDTIWLVR